MMKMLAGVEPMSGGERMVGASVQAGYFAQNLAESLHYEKTVLDELGDSTEGRSMGEIRSTPGAMIFLRRRRLQKGQRAVGGERARLALAKVLARRATACSSMSRPTTSISWRRIRCSTRSGVFRAP